MIETLRNRQARIPTQDTFTIRKSRKLNFHLHTVWEHVERQQQFDRDGASLNQTTKVESSQENQLHTQQGPKRYSSRSGKCAKCSLRRLRNPTIPNGTLWLFQFLRRRELCGSVSTIGIWMQRRHCRNGKRRHWIRFPFLQDQCIDYLGNDTIFSALTADIRYCQA